MQRLMQTIKKFFGGPLHPFFFILFPILFLYNRNINYLPFSIILLPTVVAAATVLLFFLGSYLVFKQREKSAIFTSLLVVFLMSYQTVDKIVSQVNSILSPFYLRHDVVIFGLWAAALFWVANLLKRTKTPSVAVTQALNAMALVLLFTPLLSIITFHLNLLEQKDLNLKNQSDQKKLERSLSKEPGEKPDIYYFIFDRYAGKKTLENVYKFNNDGFYKFLSDQGFFVAAASTSNYPKTLTSLVSSLNMSYLDFEGSGVSEPNSANENLTHPLLESNEVLKYLKNRGYSFFNVGPWWPVTRTNKNADKNFLPERFEVGLEEFYRTLIQETAVVPIIRWFFPETSANLYHFANHRETIKSEFNAFESVAKQKGPKFVFTHILAPHEPYVFNRNCESVEDGRLDPEVEQYLEQLECINKKVESLVKTLLVSTSQKPVIIFQADEGPIPIINKKGDSWVEASDKSIKEKFPILSAYFFPDRNYQGLYPEITPVNSFRVVFNKYFATELTLLPDKNYIYQDEKNIYKFTEVTKLLKSSQ